MPEPDGPQFRGERPHFNETGAAFLTGDRVKVIGQDISGEIVRWDGGKAMVLDDDRDTWRFDIEEEGEEGTLTYGLDRLMLESDSDAAGTGYTGADLARGPDYDESDEDMNETLGE
jgi:hypothetical protein